MIENMRHLNYFSRPEFMHFDVKTGVVRSPHGTRFVAIGEDWLKGFVGALEHEAGPASSHILRRCGSVFGGRLALRFESELTQHAGAVLRDRPMNEFAALVRDMWLAFGMGNLEVDWASGLRGFLPVKLDDSPMEEILLKDRVADDLFAGILEGFFGHFTHNELKCFQSADRRRGDRVGTAFVLAVRELAPRVESLVEARTDHDEIVAALGRGAS